MSMREIVGALVLMFCVCAATTISAFEQHQNGTSSSGVDNFIFSAFKPGFVSEFLRLDSSSDKVWPDLKLGWRVVVATIIGFVGSACGTVGGVGGGGIFVPMLNLVVGFDTKSAAALSKCMIMGASASSVWYNLRVKHPCRNAPIIDYDLALLFQPMLMMGITTGVTLSVIFPYWLITILIIILFLGTSSRSFFRGIQMWKKETKLKQEESSRLPLLSSNEDYESLHIRVEETSLLETIRSNLKLKGFSVLMLLWSMFLVIQILKNNAAVCGAEYWILNILQIPVSFGVTIYEGIVLCKRSNIKREMAGHEQDEVCEANVEWGIGTTIFCAFCGILGGIVGGLLGSGGGFILGPLLLELGVIPQVASATATFVMMFSSSLSVTEFYFLDRFPIPYALYLMGVSILAGFWGQCFIRRIVTMFGRASAIVFILSAVIFVSALTMGAVGIERTIRMINAHEYMGFLSLCHVS